MESNAIQAQLVRCPCCERDLPRSGFHKAKSRRNGLSGYCKTCKVEANRQTRARRSSPIVPDKKRCSNCKKTLSPSSFYRDSCVKTGLTPWCKECINTKNLNLTTARQQANPDPCRGLPADRKHCPKCRRVRDRGFFSVSKRRRDGLTAWCRDCKSEAQKRFRAENPDRAKRIRTRGALNYKLKQFGLTHEEYRGMIAAQGNKCAICGSPPVDSRSLDPVLHIDHCHKTGKVRGLLCPSCNHGLGHFKDDPQRVLRAARYLMGRRARCLA